MTRTCPKHETPLEVTLVLTGGCEGHWGEDDRCYCDSKDAHIELQCRYAKETIRKNHTTWSNFCTYRETVVPGLTDEASIARWIQERL